MNVRFLNQSKYDIGTRRLSKMSIISKNDYYALLEVNGFQPISPSEMAADYGTCQKQWFHLLLNESDFKVLISTPNIKWYSLCRCHLVADDGSTAHEHMHALIHFLNGATVTAFKKRLERLDKRLHSKTTFRKIICLDHAVGVLRYISCKDGQKPLRRDDDGLQGTPHSHYSQQTFHKEWIHGRGKHCAAVRDAISRLASDGVSDLSKYTSELELHDKDSCLCDRGTEGLKKKAEANRRRKEFYSTEKGMEVKKRYRERKHQKEKLIKSLLELGINKKADLQRETILRLIELL